MFLKVNLVLNIEAELTLTTKLSQAIHRSYSSLRSRFCCQGGSGRRNDGAAAGWQRREWAAQERQ